LSPIWRTWAAMKSAPTTKSTGSGKRVRTISGTVIATVHANCSGSPGARPKVR
jgi:hypothetical protein